MAAEKLYSPLNFFLRDKYEAERGQYDDINYWRDQITHEDAFAYMDTIELALRRDRESMDSERGLAEYVPDSLDDIVTSLLTPRHGQHLPAEERQRLFSCLTASDKV